MGNQSQTSFSMYRRIIQTSQTVTAAFYMRFRQAEFTSSSPLHSLGFGNRACCFHCAQVIKLFGEGDVGSWCEVPVTSQRMVATVHSHKGKLGLSM